MKLITIRHNIQLSASLLLVVALFWFISAQLVQAQQPPVNVPGNVELDGYLWSSTIGWVSMNCLTGGVGGSNVCGTSNYAVNLVASTGLLTGYAWSSNIGWVKFGGLSAFPAGDGTVAQNARVTGTYPSLDFEGWARACAGTASGNCSAMASRTDGWDGWLSLRGTNYGVRTNAATGVPNSFAWGSSVVGWVNFNAMTLLLPPASLSGTNCVIPNGASTCLAPISWNLAVATSPNVHNATTNTTYTTNVIGTTVMYPIRYGANAIQGRNGTSILRSVTLTGTCAPGADFSNGTSCEVTPVISLAADAEIIRSGSTVNLTWTISPNPLPSGTCTLRGPGMPGTVLVSGTTASSLLTSKITFVLTCTGAYGSVEASDTVDIIPTMQEV